MNKVELIAAVAEKTGQTKKDAEASVNAVFDTITKTISDKDEKVQIIGFGTFGNRLSAAKTARNPHEPTKTIEVPAAYKPTFKAGKALKDEVKKIKA